MKLEVEVAMINIVGAFPDKLTVRWKRKRNCGVRWMKWESLFPVRKEW